MQRRIGKAILGDCILFVYDAELLANITQAACLSGALVYPQLIPFVTTHVIAKEETPALQSLLAQILSRSSQSLLSNKTSLAKETPSVKLVTPQFVTSCFLAGKRVNPTAFRPTFVNT